MFTFHRTLAVLPLVVTLACTVDKGDDTTATDVSTTGTTSDGHSTGDVPTTNINEPDTSSGGATDPGDATTGGTTGDVEASLPCIDTPTVLAADEASPLGFSGAELLAGKLGSRSTTLKFASEPLALSDDIEGLELPLTFELRHDGGEIRFIDAEPNPDYDDSGNDSGFTDCTDRLEIDVGFDFVTDAGEFAEHQGGVLTATAVEQAQLRVPLLPPGLTGSFDPAAVYDPAEDPKWVLDTLEIGATWDGALAGGSLLHQVHIGEGDDGIVGFGPLAGWGDEIGF